MKVIALIEAFNFIKIWYVLRLEIYDYAMYLCTNIIIADSEIEKL